MAAKAPAAAGVAGPRTVAKAAVPRTSLPEDFLRKAMGARSPDARARWALQGLATRAPLDRTTQAMLLRQLYLSHYERGQFDAAHDVARQALDLGVLVDVFRQDASRAALAAGDIDAAVVHLRLAARRGPVSRRPFHQWTLGSVLFLAHRYDEATAALARAARWGTRDKPLYRAHLALVRLAAGDQVADLPATIEELAAAPCGRGYGRFVLGHLAYAAGEVDAARRFLEAFVRGAATSDRPELQTALSGELAMARATLAKMAAN
ncbi:MAG TPA: tetratricopeptide repeat protein [Polyangiaceae bacterium]|nr:tetratricopeptide repeat protein [Polyangiaceae bacterium]